REILSGADLEWLTLKNFPECPQAAESASTYLENAQEKSRLTAAHCGLWSLADDSGLEVEALGWKPGVRSARYAGADATDTENNARLLRELSGIDNASRRAVFRCVLVLSHPDGREFVSRGELWGRIAFDRKGDRGFGYDPIFIPEGKSLSLAQMDPAEKNRISHRTRALEIMRSFLSKMIDIKESQGSE
ncbi:MAG: non-canonical purine NTP pyrophosphatase, partial [Deltaproteobacteria bacterium]|nr:non-canonical purine NTP pyrophosphatase [Deltaproteobacteria bacterium]